MLTALPCTISILTSCIDRLENELGDNVPGESLNWAFIRGED